MLCPLTTTGTPRHIVQGLKLLRVRQGCARGGEKWSPSTLCCPSLSHTEQIYIFLFLPPPASGNREISFPLRGDPWAITSCGASKDRGDQAPFLLSPPPQGRQPPPLDLGVTPTPPNEPSASTFQRLLQPLDIHVPPLPPPLPPPPPAARALTGNRQPRQRRRLSLKHRKGGEKERSRNPGGRAQQPSNMATEPSPCTPPTHAHSPTRREAPALFPPLRERARRGNLRGVAIADDATGRLRREPGEQGRAVLLEAGLGSAHSRLSHVPNDPPVPDASVFQSACVCVSGREGGLRVATLLCLLRDTCSPVSASSIHLSGGSSSFVRLRLRLPSPTRLEQRASFADKENTNARACRATRTGCNKHTFAVL